jgi:hypothetical protein
MMDKMLRMEGYDKRTSTKHFGEWLFFTLLKSNRYWWLRAYTKMQTIYGLVCPRLV